MTYSIHNYEELNKKCPYEMAQKVQCSVMLVFSYTTIECKMFICRSKSQNACRNMVKSNFACIQLDYPFTQYDVSSLCAISQANELSVPFSGGLA